MIPYDISIKYMIAGYAVIFSVLVAYVAYLIVRWRKLIREYLALKETANK